MALEDHLLEIQPDAARVALCLPAFHIRMEVPAFTDDQVVVPVSEDFAPLIDAHAGFSMELAAKIITRVLESGYVPSVDGAISVIGDPQSSIAPFDNVVCVPPPTPRQFSGRSEVLANATTWILPAYTCEFRDGQSGQEFYAAAFRRPRIPVMEWDRQPAPELRVQLLTDWRGGMYRRMKTPFVDSLSSIVTAVGSLPAGVKLRILDLYDRQLDVEKDGVRVRYEWVDGSQSSGGEFVVEEIAKRIRQFGIQGTM